MKFTWKELGIIAAVIVVSIFLASFLKEKYDEYRLKKALANTPTSDVPMTETTATGQTLSPVR